MLQQGQIVRYENDLWRVEYVNPSRAYLVPTTKRKIVIQDEEGGVRRAFESSQRGVNVSANSVLEIVENPDLARAAQELAEAERELAVLQAEVALEAKTAVTQAPAKTAMTQAPPRTTTRKDEPVKAGHGWFLAGAERPFTHEGSLKRAVLAALAAQPGLSTKGVLAACPAAPSASAVAACLDRFMKAGVVQKK